MRFEFEADRAARRAIAKRGRSFAAAAFLFASAAASQASEAQTLPLDQIKLPSGFAIEVVAQIPSARAMTWGDRGTLFVGSSGGRVYAVTFGAPNAQGQGTVRTIASGLTDPAGVAFHNGALYVSSLGRILRFDDIERRLQSPPEPVAVTDRLPSDRHHGRKFIAFGPDGKLYINVGAPCNVCAPDPERYAHIERMNPDGSGREIVARGLRNSVGFDWDPRTKDFWFTDNGRDMLGDDAPPDKLNHVTSVPQNFGFPYCHGGDIPDPEFGGAHSCKEFVPPAQKLGPHVASLGMRFYTGTQFPAAYRNQIFIAEHGSWNRSQKIGYRVTLVQLDDARKAVKYSAFAEGWLQGDRVWGRPADVSVAPDGSLFVSDDLAGIVYRIRYRG